MGRQARLPDEVGDVHDKPVGLAKWEDREVRRCRRGRGDGDLEDVRTRGRLYLLYKPLAGETE
jgi:hypothetical protein